MKTPPRWVALLPLFVALAGCVAPSAKIDFGPWPAGTSPQEIGRRVAANFIPRPHMPLGQDRVVHYAEVCTWCGGLTFAQLTGDQALTAQLVARFEPLFTTDARLMPKAINVDNAVFGAVPLELFMQTKDARYLPIGRNLADQQWEAPANPAAASAQMKENLAAGLSRHTRFWIDDMYMITILQTQAFRTTGNRKYLDRAAREAVAYLDKLQQPNGLFITRPTPRFSGAAATAGLPPACPNCSPRCPPITRTARASSPASRK